MQVVGGTKGTVRIGKYTCLGEDIKAFMSYDHKTENISLYPFGHGGLSISKLMKRPHPDRHDFMHWIPLKINIGNDAWIGSHTVIFKSVNVGDGAVIGAYSKITKDVPPYTVVVGDNRVVRKRFSDEDTEFLLKLKWWDFDDKTVAEIAPILCSPDIGALKDWVKQHGKN